MSEDDSEEILVDIDEPETNVTETSENPEETTNAEDPGRTAADCLTAAENNEVLVLRNLLEKDPTLVNITDENSYTPLHRACYNNNVEVIKEVLRFWTKSFPIKIVWSLPAVCCLDDLYMSILLSYKANINAKTEDNWEPLHCACKWDSVEAATLLLQNGANVNAVSEGGLTPLHLAASGDSGRRTLELLLWHPYIDTSIKNNAGDTAYDIAYRSGPYSKLFEILDESINVY